MKEEDLKNVIKNVGSQLYELLSNVVCPICQELLTKPVTTPCGHSFCSACIKRVLSSKDNSGCPLCKTQVKRYGLKEDKVKLTLSQICQEFPSAFAEDVRELTVDMKDFGEDLIKTSKLSQYKQESPKHAGMKTTGRKSAKKTPKTISEEQKNDSDSFTPVLKRSKNVQEYVSAKRKRMDDLVSVSQTEPESSVTLGDPTELDKKLRKIEKIPAEEKVKEWFNAVGDNIYINSPVSELDKEEIDRPLPTILDTKESSKADPYEFIASQSTRKKPKRTRKKATKKVPDFRALQSFSKENIRRTRIAQDSMEEQKEDRKSSVEVNRITASQKFDLLLSETKNQPHALYSASSSPNFLDVSLNSKLEEKESSASKLDNILFKDVETVKRRRKRIQTDLPIRRKKLFDWKQKQTKLGELLQELVNDDIIYGTQPVNQPVRLEAITSKVKCTPPEIENCPKESTQTSALIGFDVQEESVNEVMFKKMVENLEKELNSEETENDVEKPKRELFVAFNLVGKINRPESVFIKFVQLGRLTPIRMRSKSSVVKIVFPIGLSFLARRRRRTTRGEISTGIQTSPKMVSSVAQTCQVEQSSATIQTSQKVNLSVEVQTSQRHTTSAEIQTTQIQKSCEVQTTQNVCSAQVQTTQRQQSCEVQTTQVDYLPEVQEAEAEIQTDFDRSTPRKPVHMHRKIITQETSPKQISNEEELDLEMEFERTWLKTQKSEVMNDSDDSDIRPLKRTMRILSAESMTPTEITEKNENQQKISPEKVQKIDEAEEEMEMIDLGTPKKSQGSPNSEEQMLRVLKNISLDLTKCKQDETKGEKSEESDSDFFVEQTPPKAQRTIEPLTKTKQKNEDSADVIGDSLPKGFSESFLMLTAPEKPDENDQNQLNANRESETKTAQMKAAAQAWKRSEPKTEKKICVVASSIKNPEVIRKFVARFKIEFLSKPTKDMTHLIVGLHKNEENKELPLCTPKLLFAMANKKWVVSELWAESCLKMNVILPEESFETLDPIGGCGCRTARLSTDKLLRNCQIYLLGSFQTITKEEFADLILDCGGTVVSSPEKFSYLPSKLRMIVADRECLKMDEAQIQELYEKHSTVVLSRDVIIMSIQSYKLANFSSYLLHFASEKTLVKLGYPLALVRSEEEEEEGEKTASR